MKLDELKNSLLETYKSLPSTPKYQKPLNRCSRWILLRNSNNKKDDFRGDLLVDASKMLDWATKHAQNTFTFDLCEQAAKEYFPEWLRNADFNDESITILDQNQKAFLAPYDLDFALKNWIKIYCPVCDKQYDKILELNRKNSKEGNTISWSYDWACPKQHILHSEEGSARVSTR